MLRAILVLFVTFTLSVSSYADQKPKSLPSDPRIKQFVFDENTVYGLDLHLKAITSVQFARSEQVKSILVGDSASWEVVRLKAGNVISVKPRVANAISNLTVYTDRRVYTFELRTVGEIQRAHRGNTRQAFRIRFVYPSQGQVQEFSDSATGTSGKNYDYFAAGIGRFKPIEVFDNGRQTFFKFAPNAPKPAIFKVDEKGRESIVNVRTNGNVIIADSINGLWTVRIGDEALCVASGDKIKSLPARLRRTVGLS